MSVDFQILDETIRSVSDQEPFSGSIYLTQGAKVLFAQGYAYAVRAERIRNRVDTRFQVASGSKIFTSIAICQLVEHGLLSLDTRLVELLPIDFPNFDPGISVRHLLTHSSGITSYFEEDVYPDYEALWRNVPVYNLRRPLDFLPLFQGKPMKFKPGERFEYNDGGFVLLGAIVEQVSGVSFSEYVQKNIFRRAHMVDAGYFASNQLPPRTALSYIHDSSGNWRSNIFAVPIVGGGDGGAYTSCLDWYQFWGALRTHKLLGEAMTSEFLRPQLPTGDTPPYTHYGLGVWINQVDEQLAMFFVEGGDPGVAMRSAWFPAQDILLTVLGNTEGVVWKAFKGIQSLLGLP